MRRSKVNSFSDCFVQQRDQSDCGVACLASLVKYFGGEISLEKLREISGTSKQGTTLLGLYQAANQIGLDAEGFEAELDHLKSLEHPAILHVILDGKLQHYLILIDFRDGLFLVSDPARGLLQLTVTELESIWQSRALLLVKPTDKLEQRETLKSKKREWLLSIVKEDFGILSIATLLGIIISILGISTAVFSQKLIDDILPAKDSERLILGLVLLGILLMARSSVGYIRTLVLLRQSRDFNNRIIRKFYNALLYLPKRFFDTRKTGELIARMNDTGRIQRTISFVLGDTLIQLLLGLTSLLFVLAYSWQIGVFLSLFIPIYIFVVWRYTTPITKGQRNVMHAYAANESNYIDTIQGVEVIKNQSKENVFSKITEAVYGNFQDKAFELGLIGNRFGLNTQVIGVLAMVGVLALASQLVLRGQLLLGELVAIFSMAGGLFPAIEAIAKANIQIREAKIAFDRMYEFTSIEPEFDTANETHEIREVSRLSIKDLSFRFPGRRQLLKGVNIELVKGELTCLLGESGGGKSTLIQILQKFYMPEIGSIAIDDLDYKELYPTEVREIIGVVPQEIKIFNGTLIDNILLSQDSFDANTLVSFMTKMGFDEFFKQFPQGYHTLLGEEGTNISGGQKQLIGLARALWKTPKILLLDEATSALDRNTEKFVLKLLQRLKEEMVVLLVTHRITTASEADRIYLLENGTISLSGSPSSLMRSDNFYSQFFEDFAPVFSKR